LLANAKNPSFITFITRLTSKLAPAHMKITIIRSRIKKNSSELQWVREWLLFNAKWAIAKPTRLIVYFCSIAHWNNSPQIDRLLHSDTFSWFRANQSLSLLLTGACLAEKQPTIPIL
jgi:hypothetical protein